MKNEAIIGSEFLQTMDHYLASLVHSRNFAAAVKFYEDNCRELDTAGGALAGSVLRNAAMAYASLPDYPAALKTARTAQNVVTREGESVLLAEIFLTLGKILRNMGETKEAEKAFRDAESIFRRNDCPEGQSRALNLLAGLFYKQADYKSSLSVLMDAIDIARELKEHRRLAYMMGNVGRIYTFTGDFSKAEKHLQVNIDLSTELGDRPELARASIALAYVYLQMDQYDKAEQTLGNAWRHLDTLDDKRNEVIYLTCLGELYYRSGRLSEALDALENGLKQAERITPNTTLVGRVMRHLAELNVRLRNFSTAQRYAAASMLIMKKANNKVELGALWKIKAVIAEAKGQKARAREWFVKAIDILRETGVEFEKAEALVAAGCSNLFTVRRRLTFLFLAEESYRRSGQTKRLREVEQAANSLDSSPSAMAPNNSPQSTDHTAYLTDCSTIKRFLTQLSKIGKCDLPLLLTGETGVGKDHMARYYHSLVRPGSPFVAVNCASFPETLLESELFGYHKGAFTGANTDKQGLFAVATGGVLYLDEIGDMPLVLQAKLLGVLETQRVTPLGSTEEIQLDLKLVMATNKNLQEMVACGAFRRDLYYRLSGFTFQIPALRDRKEDIPLLLRYFLKRSHLLKNNSSIPAEVTHLFVEYDWPGNIRELRNKVKQLQVMAELASEGDLVGLSRSMFSTEKPSFERTMFDRVEQLERKLIVEALLSTRGNKSEAARILGIHEATVRSKVKRYGISVEGGVVH